jgi:isoleucyl-tRNA synthetase
MAESTDFSKTLHLPQTEFAMRANLAQREPAWVQRWLDMDVYGKLRAKRALANAPKYIVHLGPPYANGNMHMGHALTYVLKDFVVRSKFMAGFDSPYAPGWDCHGLPIEWKVETDLRAEGKTKYDVSKAELRKRCREYAQKWVNVQKGEWQRFGAIGDWDRPYLTMAPQNEAGIVRELGKMVERGFVYRGLRSILWSWAEETALAEAEVEYDDNHKSTAVYVALPVVGRESEYLVIWTTTPWTLPANRAVAVAKDEVYVSLQFEGKTIWVAEALADGVAAKLGIKPEIGPDSFKGSEMVGIKVKQPLYDMDVPVVLGAHVTTDAGTGLVHTAPAHGAEDFVVGQEYGLDLKCPVDGAGKYEEWVPALPGSGKALAGRHILDKETQQDILDELQGKGWLLKAEPIVHKYPISWRSKKPLIFRTTEQWFVSMDKPIDALGGESLRDASLDRIFARNGKKGVQWVPGYGANRIGSMIENRPDWCISRQRVWGVPITIFTRKDNGAMVTDLAVFEHIAGLMEKEGIDAWDNRIEAGKVAELFPDGWLAKHNATADDFVPAKDILDVWFDSGTTHAHVLRAESGEGQRFYRNDGKRPADLYQEGSDQHRGWFHSSLLTSVANYGDAPYESVVTSGFVVDGEGRKFSKSLGNGVEPRSLLDKYGMDIIRLWVASSDYSEDIRYSPQIMDSTADAYRRFRNTFRWLLGNLNSVQDMPVVVDDLPELERYMLHRLGVVMKEVRGHFDGFQFHKAYRALYEFCGTDLSNFYFDVRKDVLYCDGDNSPLRQATLSVLVQVFRALVTHLAPLMPFTTDEAWRERYGEETCVHLEEFQPLHEVDMDVEMWAGLMALRDRVNVELEKLRAAGGLGANTEASIVVDGAFDDELVREVCGVSAVKQGAELKVAKHSGHKCPRCWRHYDKLESSGVCLRCDEAVATVKAA